MTTSADVESVDGFLPLHPTKLQGFLSGLKRTLGSVAGDDELFTIVDTAEAIFGHQKFDLCLDFATLLSTVLLRTMAKSGPVDQDIMAFWPLLGGLTDLYRLSQTSQDKSAEESDVSLSRR